MTKREKKLVDFIKKCNQLKIEFSLTNDQSYIVDAFGTVLLTKYLEEPMEEVHDGKKAK